MDHASRRARTKAGGESAGIEQTTAQAVPLIGWNGTSIEDLRGAKTAPGTQAQARDHYEQRARSRRLIPVDTGAVAVAWPRRARG